ncbi:Maestro heat-like repeat-containing protein family member 1 [Labeo rohita]|uniref:Maestro heat-like repeat-containing protein family member 1 n=1 Tax=Labeo rohita TaxID=84645 RepID=A0ABQ8LWX4_LABRO|nr:Maestro heat-like repeat-containing protein family member 1 [Labeo rohita]
MPYQFSATGPSSYGSLYQPTTLDSCRTQERTKENPGSRPCRQFNTINKIISSSSNLPSVSLNIVLIYISRVSMCSAALEQVRKSILTLGNQQPDKVLSMCQDYLLKHSKLVVGHRVVILQTIELVVKSRIDDISYPKIKSEVVPEWQQAASNILVAVGNKYINDIMEEILGKFQPGVLPHFFVVQTLASLSDSNVYGMVPFLNAIMGTMLPMLAMTKQDNMKWVFSSALCRFSESILEYLANLDKAPDPTVRKDTFSSEIYSAYDILFNSWIQSRESKLRLTVAEALGSMSHLMAHDKLEEQLPKLLPTILGLYKKNSEHYIISKVLEASVNMGSRVLETQIDGLLVALHQQICSPVDFSNPPTVKNHNEVLRCFTVLANTFPDRLMVFVLQRLENSNERNRMGSLAVKKRVVQVISAMAHHGYLELEGGDLLVRFIIQHCALPDTYHRGQKTQDPEEVTNEALRSMCDNTLHLFTTTVGRLTDVLWPMLLCYLTPNQYANATTPLCKSLILLANKKRTAQEPNFNIDFNAQGSSLPSQYILMIRLLVNAAFPFRCRGHGAPSLSLLSAISPNIHPKAEPLWEKEIPKLVNYLEESTEDSLDKKKWEEALLQLLSKTLAAIDDSQWTGQLAVEATRYLPTYNNALEEKSFLYRCIGVILQQCYNKELGVAMGIGLCASSHLDGTLEKLEEFGKSDAFKKASGIFGLLKDKNDVDVEKMKSTLILCYGYVAMHAPEDQLLTRIDSDILQNISKNFNTKVLGIKVETKDLTMKLSLIHSVGLIAKAISKSVRKHGFLFSRKHELMGVMMDFIKAEPADVMRTPVRYLVLTTCANLMYPTSSVLLRSFIFLKTVFSVKNLTQACRNLDPLLTENENFDLLKTCLNGVYGLPTVDTPDKAKDEEALDPQQREVLYSDTFNALHELLRNVLARDLSPDGLQSVFKHIESWLSSGQDHERERAVKTTADLLQFYLDDLSVKNLVTFHNLGALVGRLAPRCTDPNPEVRRAAIDCIYRLMYIQLRYEGFSLDHKDDSVEALLEVREKLSNPDHSVLYKTCSELTKIISKRLPQQQLSTLLFMLFDGLVDSQSNCSRASSVILNTLLKNRGAGLQDLVPEMLEVLHNQLQVIGEEQVKVSIGQSILILATQHLQTVVNTLVAYPLPYDSWSCEMWIALGADSTVALQIMEMIIEKLNVMVPYVDKKESMLRPADAVVRVFPKLFSSLLVRLGSSVGVQLPKDLNSNSIISDRKTTNKMNLANFDVCGVAVEALRILLARAQLDAVVKPLDQEAAWDKMKDPQQHTTGVTLLSRAMAKHAGPRLPAIVESLCPSLCNIYECQRITVTAFFSELLNHHVVTELMILDMLMNNMMERITDTCGTVRMLAVRGLGNIAVGSPEKVNKYAKELLAAMSSGMEEKDDPGKLITLEAMSGMSKILLYLDQKNVHLLVVYIFMKIKPFLENENDEIRCASIMLLGNLSKFGSGEPVFKDQIHNVLVSLLLHLSDPNPQVVKACKYAMRICAPVVGSEQISAMFQNHLLEEKGLHYGEFINDLTKYLIQDFPGMLNFYHITVIQFFKSNWAEIRASAAMFIGFLLGNLPDEHFSHMNMGSVTKGLVMLLQDPDPLVRVKAAEAMGHFH